MKALTAEDLLQAQKEISSHNHQLKEQTKQLERDMASLRDHSVLLVRHRCCCQVAFNVSFHFFKNVLVLRRVKTEFGFQLKSRCEELKLDWGSLCLESLLKEKLALRRQISEKQRHCLELQVGLPCLPILSKIDPFFF